MQRQREVVKPKEKFVKTEKVLMGGNSAPIVANKITKTKTTKQFALKKFSNSAYCAREKLCYDLLQLCGVRVPKTYIIADENDKLNILASRIEPGYKDLLFWVGGKLGVKRRKTIATFNLKMEKEIFNKQSILQKPIVGLYENLAVFVFLRDCDAIGSTLQNIGLVENPSYFQAIKIDPGCSQIETVECDKQDYGFKQMLPVLLHSPLALYWGDLGKNFDVFKCATPEQINDGLKRVMQLSDDQLKEVIYNKQLPNLSEKYKDDVFKILTTRRDAYRNLTKKASITLEEKPYAFFTAKKESIAKQDFPQSSVTKYTPS